MHMTIRKPVLLLLGIALQATCSSLLPAQAPAAGIRTLSVSIFGAADQVNPDYGPPHDRGFELGGEVTRYARHIDPSVEVRFGRSTGPVIDERFFLGDIKFSKLLLRRVRPYAEGGFGYGIGHYKNSLFDNSVIFGVGGGADIKVSTHLSARGDFQYQFWDFGTEVNGLNPRLYTVGLVYRLPLNR